MIEQRSMRSYKEEEVIFDCTRNATAGNLLNMYIDSNCLGAKTANQNKNNARVNSLIF